MAKHLAGNLTGFAHLDTGAVYRAMAYVLDQCGFDAGNVRTCTAPAVEAVTDAHVGFLLRDRLRTQDISELASVISEHGKFRSIANHVIRKTAGKVNLVLDGRDTGTVLFPSAPVKFYLWAPLEVRARRRQAQDIQHGREEKPLDLVIQELRTRDERDSRRKTAPLRMAPDAVWIDTDLVPEEAVKQIMLGIAGARLDPGSANWA